MDFYLKCGRRITGEVASDDRPLRHCPRLQASNLFFALERPPWQWVWTPSFRNGTDPRLMLFCLLPLFARCSTNFWLCKGTLLTLIIPFWPQEWFSELLSLSVAPLVALPVSRSSQTAPFSSPASEPPHA